MRNDPDWRGNHDPLMDQYWQKRQKEYEAMEAEASKEYETFDLQALVKLEA